MLPRNGSMANELSNSWWPWPPSKGPCGGISQPLLDGIECLIVVNLP
jgi:hypothetical protein